MLDLMLAFEEAAHGEPAINPYVIGGIALGVLVVLMLITLLFGMGREHS